MARRKAPDGRWRKFTHNELIARDETNLDLFRLKDDILSAFDILAEEIVETIEAGLVNLRNVVAAIGRQGGLTRMALTYGLFGTFCPLTGGAVGDGGELLGPDNLGSQRVFLRVSQ